MIASERSKFHWLMALVREWSRTQHLLISLWGRRWKEKTVANFTVYLDDSGTAPEHPIAIAGAFIIPAKKIIALETEWVRFTKANGFSDFHAAACAAVRSKDKQYKGWDDTKKRRVFTRVRQLCKKFGVKAYGWAVYKQTYDQVVPESFRRYGGGHYTWAVRHVVNRIEEWRLARKIKEPLQFIFDWEEIGSPDREEIDDIMGQFSEYLGKNIQHSFQCREAVPTLQCADLIAWLSFQLALNNFHQKPLNPIADECINDFENYYPSGRVPVNKRWFAVAAVQRRQLQDWIGKEMKDGKSLERFKDWYRRHPQREALLNARKN